MSLEARILTTDPIDAIVECARHRIPGPIIADVGCSCGLVHVDTLGDHDEAYEAFERWAELAGNRTLVDVFVSAPLD